MGCALSTERRADEAARPRGKAGSSGTHPSNAVVTRDEASSGAGVSRLSVNVAAKPALAATSPPAVSHAARYAIATPSPSCSRGAADAPAFNPSPLCRAVRSSRQRMAMSPTRHPSKSDPRVLERASSGTVMPFTDVAAVAVVSSPDALGTMSTVVVDRKRAAIREWLTTSASFHGDAGSWPSPVPEAVPKLPSAAGHHQRALFGVLDAEFGGLVSGGESPRSLFE
eukprot:CAMPEP_0174846224 /NCGR_PEP_ID=MMETSP1114-20130205/12193_1 /TAXON_ID=312471 /ORGANISM="Neobodo designis, Strain CCAP 1951/1" /LENGTH=225 /DNA_ID=CAMNT_0016080489 /DNA_START=64 /DNA_END=742 /DNA_ORIENTATION=-